MGLDLDYTDGQTPIDAIEKIGLKIDTISTLGELNELEQVNIEKALEWILKRKQDVDKILTEDFISQLHKKMFDDVWKWAGTFRTSNKNIGVDKHRIRIELKKLIDDCKYWIQNKTLSADEIAVRFSHRLVSIHPFPNGNGRHSRLIADILVSYGLGKEHFTWGSKNLTKMSEARKQYLEAIREADSGNYKLLKEFARS